jgi:hypothetical protein
MRAAAMRDEVRTGVRSQKSESRIKENLLKRLSANYSGF